MIFEEYIKLFEEILALTNKIETLCLKSKSEEADELFNKRNVLLKKLSVPEDLDDEKFAKIVKIKNEIAKKNENILKAMQKEKDMIEKDLKNIPLNSSQSNLIDMSGGELKQNNKQDNKQKPNDSSIFS